MNWTDCCRTPRQRPESKPLDAEQHHLLHHAILRIPAQLRIVLVLHDMEELDHRTSRADPLLATRNGKNSLASGTAVGAQGDEPALNDAAGELRQQTRQKFKRQPARAAQTAFRLSRTLLQISRSIWMVRSSPHLRGDARTYRSLPILCPIPPRSARRHRSLPLV